MTNHTSQVIETVTLSNTIELTDEQLAGVVGGRSWDRGDDRRGYDEDRDRGWHGNGDDWHHPDWDWHHGWH